MPAAACRHSSRLRQFPGFTLVEVLVVIVILVMLMGLLLPAINAARENARRAQCAINQFNVALALIRFNDQSRYLPGWRNAVTVGSGTTFHSWAVPILPQLERKDVFSNLPTAPYMSVYLCPSSPPDAYLTPWLSYVGSAGAGSNTAALRGSGVMLDTTGSGGRVSLDDVADNDGTATTLLISEECGPRVLTQNSWNWAGNAITWTAPGTPVFGTVGVVPSVSPLVINSGADGSATVAGAANMPSSNHPSCAVAAFCDGHTQFLKNVLAPSVYTQLMSWNHATCTATPYTTWVSGYPVLNEKDY